MSNGGNNELAIVPIDPFQPFQNMPPPSSSESQIVLFDPSNQQQLVPSSFFSSHPTPSSDLGASLQKLNIFSSPPGSPQSLLQSPPQSPETSLTKQVPQSTMNKWKNKGFLGTLENSLETRVPPALNLSDWTESEANDVNQFYSGMIDFLDSIKNETDEFINMKSTQLIQIIPDFIKKAVSSYPKYDKKLPILYFLTDETTQNQFWSYVGEIGGKDRTIRSREMAYNFIVDPENTVALTAISKIEAVESLWNKLLYTKLIDILTMAKEKDGSVRIFPWYYLKLAPKISQVIKQFNIKISVEYQIKSSEQSKGLFESWKGKLQSTVTSLTSFWPFGKKEEESLDDKTWLELQDIAFEGKKELKLKRLNNHPVQNEIFNLLEKQSKQKNATLFEILKSSVDFNILGALLNFPSGNPIFKQYLRYSKINNQLFNSFVFSEFDNPKTNDDINPTIIYYEDPDNNDSLDKLFFEQNWWSKIDDKYQNVVSESITKIIDEFRKNGGPDPLVLTKANNFDKRTTPDAYYNEALQTLAVLLKDEAYTSEIKTFPFLLKEKFPTTLLTNDRFKQYDFDFYMNKTQLITLNYPMNPNIITKLQILPPLVVRPTIQQESQLFNILNDVFDHSIDENQIPIINEQPFWFDNNPFPNITVFGYKTQSLISPTQEDLKIIGGSGFTLENLKNLFHYENIIRLNKLNQSDELDKPEFIIFKDAKNFQGSLLESWIKNMKNEKPAFTEKLELLLDKLFFDHSLSIDDGDNFLKRVSVSPFVISARHNKLFPSVASPPPTSFTLPPPSTLPTPPSPSTQPSLLNISGPAFIGIPSTVSDFMTSKRKSRRRSLRRKAPRRKVIRRRRRSRTRSG